MVERFIEQAHRVLDLAREEAERCGHRYLGPEHVLLGVLAEGHSGAARVLRAYGVELAAARAGLRRLAGQGVVPAPRPSDAQLLSALGIDLDAIRHNTEQAFGVRAVGEATWRVTRRHRWRASRVVWTPLCGPPFVAKRALQLAGRAGVAARYGREAGGVSCDGSASTWQDRSATFPHLRLADRPHQLSGWQLSRGRSCRQPCRSRRESPVQNEEPLPSPVMRRRRASGRRGRRTGRRG